MILTLGNVKGGVGKTTLAVNLAIERTAAGRKVLLVDADAQHTASTFTKARTEELGDPGYATCALEGMALVTQIPKHAENFDDVIIDSGGRDTDSLRAAMTVSDMLLIPTQPRSPDIWSTVEHMVKIVALSRAHNPTLRVAIIINEADAQGSDNADAAMLLDEDTSMPVLPFTIGRRKAFANAISNGLGVSECKPRDQKAVGELMELVTAIYAPVLAEA